MVIFWLNLSHYYYTHLHTFPLLFAKIMICWQYTIIICKQFISIRNIISFSFGNANHFPHSKHPWQPNWFTLCTYASLIALSEMYMSPFYGAFKMNSFLNKHTRRLKNVLLFGSGPRKSHGNDWGKPKLIGTGKQNVLFSEGARACRSEIKW